MLSAEQQKKIKKSLRDYAKQFEDEDLKASTKVSKEVEERRKRLIEDWYEWRAHVTQLYEADAEERKQLLGEDEHVNDEEDEEIEELIEELIKETEEIVY